MIEDELKKYSCKMIYRPDNYDAPIPSNATVGVRFCQDIFLMKSFLDQKGIEYKIEDLEDSPMGLGFRIKRDSSAASSAPSSPQD